MTMVNGRSFIKLDNNGNVASYNAFAKYADAFYPITEIAKADWFLKAIGRK